MRTVFTRENDDRDEEDKGDTPVYNNFLSLLSELFFEEQSRRNQLNQYILPEW